MIYLVRHGQTVFNREGRFQGQSDSPLTTLGERQARSVGARLASLLKGQTYRLVTSPLGRARTTARLIADVLGHDGAVADDPRLAELAFGQWELMTGEDIDFSFPGARNGLDRFSWQFAAPDGETHAALSARIAAWLAEHDEDETVVAVSHGMTSRVLRGLYAGLDPGEALKAATPQDVVFRLSGGQVEQLECEVLPA